jgi:hypothetical protein
MTVNDVSIHLQRKQIPKTLVHRGETRRLAKMRLSRLAIVEQLLQKLANPALLPLALMLM